MNLRKVYHYDKWLIIKSKKVWIIIEQSINEKTSLSAPLLANPGKSFSNQSELDI